VPIEEHIIFQNVVYSVCPSRRLVKPDPELNLWRLVRESNNLTPLRKIQLSQHQELSNPVLNSVVALANETTRDGYGALVFCSSRAGCELDDQLIISQVMPELRELAGEVRKDLLNERQ
jgi:hypothetical protein